MKGQRYRFFKEGVPFESETSCELHISVETEETSNKDYSTPVAWPEGVGCSFDATIECQVKNYSGSSYVLPTDLEVGVPVDLELCKTSETSNTTKETVIASGTFIPTSISYKADNKKTVTATIKLEGTGVLTV